MTNPLFAIRRASIGDAGSLISLYRQLVPSEELEVGACEHTLRAIEENEATSIFVLVNAGGRVVSTCMLIVVPNLTHGCRPFAIIENVVSDAAFRGYGYGNAVVQHALEEARRCNACKVVLSVRKDNASAVRFYEKIGFTLGKKEYLEIRYV